MSIILVHMPYAAVERPSIGLGTLQACLERAGLRAEVVYANLWWAERIGLKRYKLLEFTPTDVFMGEWTFAKAAFPDFESDSDAYFREAELDVMEAIIGPRQQLRPIFEQLREQAPAFVDEVARRILARNPRVVGAGSTFQQHCASLALLRRLKELDPGLITVMGGANCEGEMGLALVRNFGWVDYVVSGEADKLAGEFFAGLLAGRSQLPYGVITRDWQGEAPRATFAALDQLPVPDYDDYFRALQASSLDVLPGLLVETSRGCWWGQKHHCTFCGLNGSGMGYRSKSGPRVLAELDSLSERYQLDWFEVVDNILDHSHLKTVMPTLAARSKPLLMFYETKSNLKRDQVHLLASAGVLWIQPGIESLHDDILRLMDKGSTALMNVQLLQHAREFGVRVIWNFLTCFPGEKDEWNLEMAGWLPLLHHLQPANSLAPIRYDRFSPYFTDPQRYGIRICAASTYRAVYDLPAQELEKLAYFFEDHPDQVVGQDRRQDSPGRQALSAALKVWSEAFWNPLPPLLSMSDLGHCTNILDTRQVAWQRRYQLTGRCHQLLQECRTPRRFEDPEPALLELMEKKLVLRTGDRYLSLPVAGSLPSLPGATQFPGGFPERPATALPYTFPLHLGGALA